MFCLVVLCFCYATMRIAMLCDAKQARQSNALLYYSMQCKTLRCHITQEGAAGAVAAGEGGEAAVEAETQIRLLRTPPPTTQTRLQHPEIINLIRKGHSIQTYLQMHHGRVRSTGRKAGLLHTAATPTSASGSTRPPQDPPPPAPEILANLQSHPIIQIHH